MNPLLFPTSPSGIYPQLKWHFFFQQPLIITFSSRRYGASWTPPLSMMGCGRIPVLFRWLQLLCVFKLLACSYLPSLPLVTYLNASHLLDWCVNYYFQCPGLKTIPQIKNWMHVWQNCKGYLTSRWIKIWSRRRITINFKIKRGNPIIKVLVDSGFYTLTAISFRIAIHYLQSNLVLVLKFPKYKNFPGRKGNWINCIRHHDL